MSPEALLCLGLYATIGGGERALLELLSGLDRSRYQPLVVLGADGPLVERLRARGLEVVVEPFPTPPLFALAWPPTLVAALGAAFRLRALVRARRVRIAHCGDLLALLLLLPLRASGARIVFQANFVGGRPRRLLLRLLAVAVDAIVAYSEDQRRTLGRSGALLDRTVVVYPGIDTAPFAGGDGARFRRELGLAPATPLVGLLARYDVWKGHDVFLDAAARILERRPDVRFAMVGGALNRESLPHVARYQSRVMARLGALGLRGSVTTLGHRDDVPDVLAACDVVACPSLHEPFGMVVIEAMAAGRPVVASDSGGPAEIIEDGKSGLLFRTGDAGALAGAVLRLLADPVLARRLGQAGRARVEARFTRERYVREMEGVYARLA